MLNHSAHSLTSAEKRADQRHIQATHSKRNFSLSQRQRGLGTTPKTSEIWNRLDSRMSLQSVVSPIQFHSDQVLKLVIQAIYGNWR